MTATLVLLRHGQSEWNQKNIFSGWVDIDLSEQGREEARRAGVLLGAYQFDAVFCSALKRAQETARIALAGKLPACYFADPALNERHYGDLQGINKDEARAQFGVEQVHKWRRSFLERPPGGESLKDTCDRVLPYYIGKIEPRLRSGQTVLIVAHGNSLRALIKYLDKLSDKDIVNLEIPTGKPIVYSISPIGLVISKTELEG
jgi:2,3-bisphosphoglycerate-dependent phosphoglycerate mutase